MSAGKVTSLPPTQHPSFSPEQKPGFPAFPPLTHTTAIKIFFLIKAITGRDLK